VEGFGRRFAPGVGKSAARWPMWRAKPSIGGDLTAFRLKTPPMQEFLVHEQAIEENLYTSFTFFYSIFNATTD
jgi:hypothetical protein